MTDKQILHPNIKHFRVMPFGISLEDIGGDKLAVWITYGDSRHCIIEEIRSRTELHETVGRIIVELTLKMNQNYSSSSEYSTQPESK